jgi:hypothetical protein
MGFRGPQRRRSNVWLASAASDGLPRAAAWRLYQEGAERVRMRFVTAILFLLVCRALGQQPLCELVPETQLPKCKFTVRSNYGLRGQVHTIRDVEQDLAPDPLTHDRAAGGPRLPIKEPGVWLVFDAAGEMLENAGSLTNEGKPVNPSRYSRAQDGSTTIVISGTDGQPNSFRKTEKSDQSGSTVEELTFNNGKLSSRYVRHVDKLSSSVETQTYDADGKLVYRSIDDLKGDEHTIFNNGNLELHVRDVHDGDPAKGKYSREWYDEYGRLVGYITLVDGQLASWWASTETDMWRRQSHTLGWNFPFQRSVAYSIEPNGSLWIVTERHDGHYGNIDNDLVELCDVGGNLLERIAYHYVRDDHGNWTERTTSILDPATGIMVNVRRDIREITYY